MYKCKVAHVSTDGGISSENCQESAFWMINLIFYIPQVAFWLNLGILVKPGLKLLSCNVKSLGKHKVTVAAVYVQTHPTHFFSQMNT